MFEKTKKHFKDNRKYYIVGGAVAVVSIVGTAIVVSRIEVVQDAFNIKIFSPTNNNIIMKGHPGNIIEHLETSKALGISAADISRHLNGKLPNAGGQTFKSHGLNLSGKLAT